MAATHDSSSANNTNEMPADDEDSFFAPSTGYVSFDDPSKLVRISLNSRSKSERGLLKRKLVTELDRVRNLKNKLDQSHHNLIPAKDNNHNRVPTLARVNSEVSCVGPNNSRPFDDGLGDSVDRDKKRRPNSAGRQDPKGLESKKKLKPCGGGSEAVGFPKDLVRKCQNVLGKLMNHKYGWVFNKPVDVRKLKLHDYYTIIKHPMDLGTVNDRLSKNWYKSPMEFAEDVRLTFNNAMKYNDKGQDAHIMAQVLLKLFEDNWAAIAAKLGTDESVVLCHDSSLPTSPVRRVSAAPAHVRAASKPDLPTTRAIVPPSASEKKIMDRSETKMMPVNPKSKTTEMDANKDKLPPLEKVKTKNHKKRDMTYQEKQRLSSILQNLPSEKLDTVVQIIRKRNPGLFQQEDEIEVDIDSFDAETLWELESFVNDCQNTLSNNSRNVEDAAQGGEAVHVIQGANMASDNAGKSTETGAGQKQGDSVSRSSCSSSSKSNSGSSSSDSDSGSSSRYGSDAG